MFEWYSNIHDINVQARSYLPSMVIDGTFAGHHLIWKDVSIFVLKSFEVLNKKLKI